MVNDGASYKTSLVGYDSKYYVAASSSRSHLEEVDEDLSDAAARANSKANGEATTRRGEADSSSSKSSINDSRCTSDSDEEPEPLLMATSGFTGNDKSVIIPYDRSAVKATPC